MAEKGLPISRWADSAPTDQLRVSVEAFARDSRRQANTMIWLTVAIVVLTIMMMVEVGYQIFRVAQLWSSGGLQE